MKHSHKSPLFFHLKILLILFITYAPSTAVSQTLPDGIGAPQNGKLLSELNQMDSAEQCMPQTLVVPTGNTILDNPEYPMDGSRQALMSAVEEVSNDWVLRERDNYYENGEFSHTVGMERTVSDKVKFVTPDTMQQLISSGVVTRVPDRVTLAGQGVAMPMITFFRPDPSGTRVTRPLKAYYFSTTCNTFLFVEYTPTCKEQNSGPYVMVPRVSLAMTDLSESSTPQQFESDNGEGLYYLAVYPAGVSIFSIVQEFHIKDHMDQTASMYNFAKGVEAVTGLIPFVSPVRAIIQSWESPYWEHKPITTAADVADISADLMLEIVPLAATVKKVRASHRAYFLMGSMALLSTSVGTKFAAEERLGAHDWLRLAVTSILWRQVRHVQRITPGAADIFSRELIEPLEQLRKPGITLQETAEQFRASYIGKIRAHFLPTLLASQRALASYRPKNIDELIKWLRLDALLPEEAQRVEKWIRAYRNSVLEALRAIPTASTDELLGHQTTLRTMIEEAGHGTFRLEKVSDNPDKIRPLIQTIRDCITEAGGDKSKYKKLLYDRVVPEAFNLYSGSSFVYDYEQKVSRAIHFNPPNMQYGSHGFIDWGEESLAIAKETISREFFRASFEEMTHQAGDLSTIVTKLFTNGKEVEISGIGLDSLDEDMSGNLLGGMRYTPFSPLTVEYTEWASKLSKHQIDEIALRYSWELPPSCGSHNKCEAIWRPEEADIFFLNAETNEFVSPHFISSYFTRIMAVEFLQQVKKVPLGGSFKQ